MAKNLDADYLSRLEKELAQEAELLQQGKKGSARVQEVKSTQEGVRAFIVQIPRYDKPNA
ncbi:hypothetical protein ACFL3T_01565 [Patescibacteria group bacterium]